jgi:hypothetical protein
VNEGVIRAWWAHRQGLDGSLMGATAAEVLARTGWARSVGGVGPYLTLFARAGLGRAAIDAAVADLAIHELPAARGCTYVVPATDYALALRVGQGFGDAAEIATAKKYCGVTDGELDRLCRRVIDALDAAPRDPRELKEAVGDAVRSLGAEGKKRGVATTLPLALGKLQAEGAIRRVPVNGRLDQQRYRYARWRTNTHPGWVPGTGQALSDEEAHSELARRFFRWTGPATLAHFQWFSGLGVKAARAAIAPLGLAMLAPDDGRLLFPDDREALLAFAPPREPHYALVSGVDGIALLRRDVLSLLDPADAARSAFGNGQPMGGLSDLPNHAILDRGRLIGLWEFDPARGRLVWATFDPPTAALREAVARTEAFVRDDLGDARSFSLDSPESRGSRIAAIERAAALVA